MRRTLAAMFAMMVLSPFAAHAFAEQDLAGAWDINWPNGSRNAVHFDAGKSDGTYITDSGAKCAIAAKVPDGASVTKRIDCADWSISMQGAPASGATIKGTYVSSAMENGPFVMLRRAR